MIRLFVFELGNVILPFEHRQIAVKLHEVSRTQLSLPAYGFRLVFSVG
jgi:hypothetical protein